MEYITPAPYENPFEENKRPGFLTFLCVLTFIGSGFALLSNLITPVFAPMLMNVVQESSFASIPGYIEAIEKIMATPIWQFYLLALFCTTSILGAVYMLKMKKIGFHIYTVSKLVQLCIARFLMAETNFFSWFITLLFIGLYAIFYKKFTDMKETITENN